jgi:hypothetical protein
MIDYRAQPSAQRRSGILPPTDPNGQYDRYERSSLLVTIAPDLNIRVDCEAHELVRSFANSQVRSTAYRPFSTLLAISATLLAGTSGRLNSADTANLKGLKRSPTPLDCHAYGSHLAPRRKAVDCGRYVIRGTGS